MQSANHLLQNINLNLTIVDDNSDNITKEKIKLLLKRKSFVANIINLNLNEFHDKIKVDENAETFSNLASLLKCF